jgi:hypothetical protein
MMMKAQETEVRGVASTCLGRMSAGNRELVESEGGGRESRGERKVKHCEMQLTTTVGLGTANANAKTQSMVFIGSTPKCGEMQRGKQDAETGRQAASLVRLIEDDTENKTTRNKKGHLLPAK